MGSERFNGVMLALQLALVLAASAPVPFDDIYEENDTCAEAALLAVTPNGVLQSFSFTTSGAASAGGADEDWFSIDVPGGHRVQVWTFGTFPGNPGVDVRVFEGADCGTLLATGFVAGSVIEFVNDSSTSRPYVIQFDPVNVDLVQEGLWLQVRIEEDLCATQLAPDPFEPNDSAAMAPVLSSGLHRDLTITPDSRLDFYRVAVPRGDALQVQFLSRSVVGTSVECRVLDPLGEEEFHHGPMSGAGLATVVNGSDSDWLLLQVGLENSGAPLPCDAYDLYLNVIPTPCSGLVDDALEGDGNNEREQATHITRGFYPDLTLTAFEADWYSVTVPDGFGVSLVATLAPDSDEVNSVFYPYGPTVFGDEFDRAAHYFGNTTGEARTVELRLANRLTQGRAGCTRYDLEVKLTPLASAPTTCMGTGHSGQGPVELYLFGSSVAADNGLWLTALNLPGGSPRLTVFAGFPDSTPPVTPGVLCLTPPITRLGTTVTPFSQLHIPLELGEAGALAGTTFAFQAATAVGPAVRLSDTVTVQLQ